VIIPTRTVEDIVEAAFMRTKVLTSNFYITNRKSNRYRKRVKNRQTLYDKKLRLGKKL